MRNSWHRWESVDSSASCELSSKRSSKDKLEEIRTTTMAMVILQRKIMNAEGNHDDSGDDVCGDKEGLDKLREKGGQAVPTVQRVQFRSSDKYIYIEDDEIKIYVWT